MRFPLGKNKYKKKRGRYSVIYVQSLAAIADKKQRHLWRNMVRLGPCIPLYAITKEKGLVYRVPECLSLRLNWLPLPPFPASECVSAPTYILGGDTLACSGGGGRSQFRRPSRNSGTLYTLWAQLLYLNWFNFFDNRDCIQKDPMPELTITSPYVHSRVDSSTNTTGNPMPESTLALCQSRLYPYARADFYPPSKGLRIWSQ